MMKKGDPIHKYSLVAFETTLTLRRTLTQNVTIHAMTFNGTVPGPIVRVTEGDLINVTLINPLSLGNKSPHSLDNHAAIINTVPNSVGLGWERSYVFIATQPGFFEYHCEGNFIPSKPISMDQHVFSGMVGGVIVDPAIGYTGYKYPTYADDGSQITQTVSPRAKEVALIFSEWYLTNKTQGNIPPGNYDQTAMFNHQPTFTWINGIPFGYDSFVTKPPGAIPLQFNQGDHVRFFLLNAGDVMVSFNIAGEHLDRVISGQVVQGWGEQTHLLGSSKDAIIDVVFNKTGLFTPANHDYASLLKGQLGFVKVTPGDQAGLNPSNAIPPMGKDSIACENYAISIRNTTKAD